MTILGMVQLGTIVWATKNIELRTEALSRMLADVASIPSKRVFNNKSIW